MIRFMVWMWVACTGATFTLLLLLGQPPVGWAALDVATNNAAWIGFGWMVGTVGTQIFLTWRDGRRSR